MEHFKFVNWRIRFLMSQTGYKKKKSKILIVITDPTAKPNKKKRLSPAMQKRETLRRARNKNGILLSSLKKKIYHCNCVDCQAKRVAEGKPAYLEPIFVEEMDLGMDFLIYGRNCYV